MTKKNKSLQATNQAILVDTILSDSKDINILQWKVNTPQLLKEILSNDGVSVLHKPLSIFGYLLAEVGERASELNDPKLNALMCRLTIYEIADPYSENYNAELTNRTIEAGR